MAEFAAESCSLLNTQIKVNQIHVSDRMNNTVYIKGEKCSNVDMQLGENPTNGIGNHEHHNASIAAAVNFFLLRVSGKLVGKSQISVRLKVK